MLRASIGVAVGVWSANASAQEILGARAVGLAESQRALVNGNDALYLNPGGMALSSVYSVEGNYVDDLNGGERRINASIMDSQAGEIAGGLAYTFSTRSFSNDRSLVSHRVEGGLSVRAAEGLGLGAVLRWIGADAKIGDKSDDAGSFSMVTADFGGQYRLDSGVGFGAAVTNLFNNEEPRAPLSWAAGVGYDNGKYSAEVDLRHDTRNDRFRVSLGAGVILSDTLAVRAGTSYETKTKRTEISGGFGYGTREWGLDAGYVQRVSGEEDPTRSERLLAIGLRLYFF